MAGNLSNERSMEQLGRSLLISRSGANTREAVPELGAFLIARDVNTATGHARTSWPTQESPPIGLAWQNAVPLKVGQNYPSDPAFSAAFFEVR